MTSTPSESSGSLNSANSGDPSARWWFLSKKFKKDASLLIQLLWKYRRFTFYGLIALVTVDLLELIPPYLLLLTVDGLVAGGPFNIILKYGLIYMGVAAAQAVCRYFWRMYLIRTSMFAGRDLRDLFARHVFRLSTRFFDQKPIGELMSHATNDTEAIRLALGPGIMVLADAAFYFLSVPTFMFILSPKLTLISFLPLLLVPIIVIRNEKLIDQRFEKVQESFSHLSALAQENISGMRLVKGFANEAEQIGRFDKAGLHYSKLNVSLAKVQSGFGPTLDFVMSFSLVILIAVGGKSVLADTITIGTFVAFQRYIQKLVWPMEAIGYAITFYQRAVASSKRLKRVFGETSDVQDKPNPHKAQVRGRIEFKNLSFVYPHRFTPTGSRLESREIPPTLKNIDLVIEPGMRVALVGGIGSGKTTLLALIARLYRPQDQQLFLDDIDINDWELQSLRTQVGIVTQEAFLFSDTIRSNIEFGLNQDGISELQRSERVTRAALQASVDREIQLFERGYETKVGERGITVSGGQRQRLTLARTFIKDARVLMLDDALAAVDLETETLILRELNEIAANRTVLIAAHRISTVKNADKIVVLKDGQIVDSGTHRKLLATKGGIYARYYEQQRLREDVEKYAKKLEKTY